METSNSFSFYSFGVVLLILSNNISLITSSSKSFLINSIDQQALIAFNNTITNGFLTNWSINTTTSVCEWVGVSCSSGRVRALNLTGLGLRGTIAPHLGNLTFLQSLDMSYNNFTDALPSELSKLRRLQYINIGANSFAGEIPPWLGALSHLEHIYLYNNTFSGGIPASLFNISRLRTLDLSYNSLDENVPEEIGNLGFLELVKLENNKLRGSIPSAIFNISSLVRISVGRNSLSGKIPDYVCNNTPKLKRLSLFGNQLSGEIPPQIERCKELQRLSLSINRFSGNIPIQNLTMLQHIYLGKNHFKGTIPKEFGNLTFLTHLSLEYNLFSGELPEEIANLRYLESLRVDNNSLSGAIPSLILNISTLQAINLSFNKFSGTLPSNMGLSLPNLIDLRLHVNSFSGPIPISLNNASLLNFLSLQNNSFSGSIPTFPRLTFLTVFLLSQNNLTQSDFLSSLSNSQYLRVVDVSDNPIGGVISPSVGNLSQSLEAFRARGATIRGVIPSQIGNLTNLIRLNLYDNQLQGSIPSTIGNCKKLGRLLLSRNQLQGSIPIGLCQMSSLAELDLSNNVLEGPIPECLGGIQSLREIHFGSNKLNSSIPSNFWNLVDLVDLNLSSNYLSGEISPQIGKLKVNKIDFSFNLLSGDIPTSIDGCQSLEYLTLSNNKFGGSIPQTLGNMRGLRELDLSYNSLHGLIPKSLQDLKFLEHLNVSYNRLEGEISNGGAFANFTPQMFIHNSALCGAPRFEVPHCIKVDEGLRSKSVARFMKYILPPLVATMLLMIVVVLFLRRWRRVVVPIQVETTLGVGWRVTSYIDLLRATDSFSETNLLGRGSFGSVFRGTVSQGLNVAVKVFNLELEGGNKSFETKSRILSTIRHRNLVRIISCCTNMEFKALILEYMPNGSLEKWLYSDNYCLDLIQRIDIAIDVALAVEYLHHGHTFPIVHCDIKPSNVLLDGDMIARVADFGIAKLFEDGEAMVQTTTLATIGYAAPEYGLEGIVSTSADVYSYGIMLLELLTRKKPTDDMFNGEMSLKEWVSEALQVKAIDEVLAPALLLPKQDSHFVAQQECLASIFELAIKCLAFLPNQRINMIQVSATLRKIKAKAVTCN